MNRNEQFSYNDDAVLITDDFVADEDYSTCLLYTSDAADDTQFV